MAKLSLFNKLFIAFFALLVMLIIWKVPQEKNNAASQTSVSIDEDLQ